MQGAETAQGSNQLYLQVKDWMGHFSRRKQRWVTIETGLQGEPCLPRRMVHLLGTEAGDCRDRSIRRASLPALLVRSFDDSRPFVTQETQRQLLSSGDGFSYHSQWYKKSQEPVGICSKGALTASRPFCSDLQISPEGPAGMALSLGPTSVKRLEEQRASVEGASTVPTALHLWNFLVPPRAGGWPGFFFGWK